ncbi:MAG TPA: sulfotransferase family protein, partial [Nocardioides sp.]|nr:sulfotransferase family protein [Nocardioides sp.]
MPTSTTPLVLVSGSGRSGTSSLAGTLKRLGLHVPQPEVEASETNPRGFYEPQWVIDFHKRHLKELALFNIDSRPQAVDLVAAYVASGVPGAELREWLAGQLDADQVVVKDPHAFWFAEVWEDVSAELGADLRWLTALRHPAEVVGSRDIAYLSSQSDDLRLTKETSNVAGWVHAALLTERAGRGRKRSFVRYADLLADWRSALVPVQQQLELDFNTDVSSSERDHHAVDDFIEPSMRKSQLTWDDVRTPDWLRDMAEEVWQLLGVLTGSPQDAQTLAALDRIHDDYRARYADAVARTFDHTKAESTLAGREARDAQRGTVQQLRRELAEARRHGSAGT